ncbi:MAG: hypothetical protein KTR33_10915 [Gammaproteobacteria bacterium]|nr:hypothetical protein [Gammaproteobacteria bacterium]
MAGPKLSAALQGLWIASDAIVEDAPDRHFLESVVAEGVFRPNSHERIGYWFARYLTIRQSLWDLIREVLQQQPELPQVRSDPAEWRHFLTGYAAACLLIRIDRVLLFEVATDSLVQRKLNEAFSEYRIPRKQYTGIFSAYVNRTDALAIYDAIRLAREHRASILALQDDPEVGEVVRRLSELERYLDPSRRNYLRSLASYFSHKWRRKSVVSLSNSLARIMERFGRAASALNPPIAKRVTPAIQMQFARLLQPGDIIVTRHDHAVTNLFLPGFWPHAALFVGTRSQREHLGIRLEAGQNERWAGECCVLEALKDGVRFRPLNETLSVDNVAVLRPVLSPEAIRAGIERAIQHEGKLYNFDFDFFNAERLVCTEVIYRGFDGLEGIDFPLTERAGRKTLSAEDLLDYAFATQRFQPVAVYGVGSAVDECRVDDSVSGILLASYRDSKNKLP